MAHHIKKVIFVTKGTRQMAYTVPTLSGVSSNAGHRKSHFWNTIYPALGSAVWHSAPQSVFANPAPDGNLSLVATASVPGLMWGRVVRQSGSIRWTTLSHILFDFSSLGGLYFRR